MKRALAILLGLLLTAGVLFGVRLLPGVLVGMELTAADWSLKDAQTAFKQLSADVEAAKDCLIALPELARGTPARVEFHKDGAVVQFDEGEAVPLPEDLQAAFARTAALVAENYTVVAGELLFNSAHDRTLLCRMENGLLALRTESGYYQLVYCMDPQRGKDDIRAALNADHDTPQGKRRIRRVTPQWYHVKTLGDAL